MDVETLMRLGIAGILLYVVWLQLSSFFGRERKGGRGRHKSASAKARALQALNGNEQTLQRLYEDKRQANPQASDEAIYREIYEDWLRDNR